VLHVVLGDDLVQDLELALIEDLLVGTTILYARPGWAEACSVVRQGLTSSESLRP
jgi:hypothetical protein